MFTPAHLRIVKLPASILHTVRVVVAALAAARTTVSSRTSSETEAWFLLRSLLECQERRTCLPLVVPVRSSRQLAVRPKPELQETIQIRNFVVGRVAELEPERNRSWSRQLAQQQGVVRRESLLQVARTEDQQVAENTEELQAVGHTEEQQAVARIEELLAVGSTEGRRAVGNTAEWQAAGRTEEPEAVGRTEEPQAVGHTAELQVVGRTVGPLQAAWNSSSKGSRFEEEAKNRNLLPWNRNESPWSYLTWFDWRRRTFPAEVVGRRNLSRTGFLVGRPVYYLHYHASSLF